MQATISEPTPKLPVFTKESEYVFFEPKRVVLSPFEVCLLSEPEDLFEDE